MNIQTITLIAHRVKDASSSPIGCGQGKKSHEHWKGRCVGYGADSEPREIQAPQSSISYTTSTAQQQAKQKARGW